MSKLKPIIFTSLPSSNKYDSTYSRYPIIHSILIGLEIITVSNSILVVDILCLIYSFRTLKLYFEQVFTNYSQSSQ